MSTEQQDLEDRLNAIEARQDAFSRKLGLDSDQHDLSQQLDVIEARQDALSKKLGALAECLTGDELLAAFDGRDDSCLAVRLDELEEEFTALGRQVSRLNGAVTGRPGRKEGTSDRNAGSP